MPLEFRKKNKSAFHITITGVRKLEQTEKVRQKYFYCISICIQNDLFMPYEVNAINLQLLQEMGSTPKHKETYLENHANIYLPENSLIHILQTGAGRS